MPLSWPVLLAAGGQSPAHPGKPERSMAPAPPYGLSPFPRSWAHREWSWIHPSVLKGKFSPQAQRESVPTGAVSLEKDHLKL